MTPDSHEHVESLLGAWALDACSAEEAEVVMDHIMRCPKCADEAVRLRGAAAALTGASPPRTLRTRVLGRAPSGRVPLLSLLSPAAAYAAPYAAQISVLDVLLAELAEPDWSLTVLQEYGWSVQDLVAHLAATDGLLAGQLGVPVEPPLDNPLDVDARTAQLIAAHRGSPAAQTRTAWRDQAAALCSRLNEQPPTQTVDVAWPLPVSSAVLARAFETWIHATDIARAVGRVLPAPLPEHLHPMADLGVRSLPQALALHNQATHEGTARVVLDGPGGGTWLIPLTPTATQPPDPAVTLQLDVLEFCFLAGGRRDPYTISVRIEGDEETGRDLLAAAPAFSGP